MNLFLSTDEQIAVKSAWNPDAVTNLSARLGDTWPLNVFFLDRNVRSAARPYDIHRYTSATVAAKLLDFNGNQLATASAGAEIVPTTTAPILTRVVSGSASVGEYDRITLASPPGSGTLNLVMQGGSASQRGSTSASARIVPTITNPRQAAAAFANMLGAPWTVEFVSDTIIDIHGSITPSGTTAKITTVDVSDLGYLYGWPINLALTGIDASFAANPTLYPVTLVILLTPSGGSLVTAAKIPITLLA